MQAVFAGEAGWAAADHRSGLQRPAGTRLLAGSQPPLCCQPGCGRQHPHNQGGAAGQPRCGGRGDLHPVCEVGRLPCTALPGVAGAHRAQVAPLRKCTEAQRVGRQAARSEGSQQAAHLTAAECCALRPPCLPPLCRDIERQSLRVRVMGSDKRHQLSGGYLGSAEEYLGSAQLHDLRAICDGQPHELDLQLRGSSAGSAAEADAGSSGGGGSVLLTCRFLPFSAILALYSADSEMGAPMVVGAPGQVRCSRVGGLAPRCICYWSVAGWPGAFKLPIAHLWRGVDSLLQIPLAAEWQGLLELAGVATHALFTPLAFVEHATTNSQAWLYWNKRERTACVAFRGTEQGQWKVCGVPACPPACLPPSSSQGQHVRACQANPGIHTNATGRAGHSDRPALGAGASGPRSSRHCPQKSRQEELPCCTLRKPSCASKPLPSEPALL